MATPARRGAENAMCSPVAIGVATEMFAPRRARAPRTTKAPPERGFRLHAPKRTRTSTRLSRTRPSTWRVYQFRHRREGGGEYSPGGSCRLSPSRGGDTFYEHMFARLDQPAGNGDLRRPLPWTSA